MTDRSSKLRFIAILITACAACAVFGACSEAPASKLPVVQVYKTPTCGCCGKWVEHMRDNGFSVETTDLTSLSEIKRDNGIPADLASCHTALVDGYVVEGHVPAPDVIRLLEERPSVSGIAVPKMPVGSPGMEGPNPESYEVISFDAGGRVGVYASHQP